MVDFNNETTITTNPKDVYNVILLEHNEYVLDSLEAYEKHKFSGVNVNSNIIRARIKNLYRHIRHDFRKNTKTELYTEAERLFNTETFTELIKLYDDYISVFLADIGLTAKTKRKDYDPLNASEEDDAKGL